MGKLTVNGSLATDDDWCWGSQGGSNESGENFHFKTSNDLSVVDEEVIILLPDIL